MCLHPLLKVPFLGTEFWWIFWIFNWLDVKSQSFSWNSMNSIYIYIWIYIYIHIYIYTIYIYISIYIYMNRLRSLWRKTHFFWVDAWNSEWPRLTTMVARQAVATDPAKAAIEAMQALKNLAASWHVPSGMGCDVMWWMEDVETPEPLGASDHLTMNGCNKMIAR